MMEPQDAADEKFGAAAREKLEAICTTLRSTEALDMTHSSLESSLRADGDELLRLLLQDHFDLRAVRERAPDAPVEGQPSF